MTGRTLRLAIRHDWLPEECIVALPPRLKSRAIRAGLASGRFSPNDARRMAGLA